MTTFRLAVVALCFSATMIIPAVAADPAGTWYTGDRESQVRITNCGALPSEAACSTGNSNSRAGMVWPDAAKRIKTKLAVPFAWGTHCRCALSRNPGQ